VRLRLWSKASQGRELARPHLHLQLDIVAYTCHPKIWRRLRLGGLWFQTNPGKSFQVLISMEKNLGMVVHTGHHNYRRKHKIEGSK
jgi:hypothetical protein